MASRFENCIDALVKAGKVPREIADKGLRAFDEAKRAGLDDARASLQAAEALEEAGREVEIETARLIVKGTPTIGIEARASMLGSHGGGLRVALGEVRDELAATVAAREGIARGTGRWLERQIEEAIGAIYEARRLDAHLPKPRDYDWLELPLEIAMGKDFSDATRTILSLFYKVPSWFERYMPTMTGIIPSAPSGPRNNIIAPMHVIRDRLRGFLEGMRDPRIRQEAPTFDLLNTEGAATRPIAQNAPQPPEKPPAGTYVEKLDAARALVLHRDIEINVPAGDGFERRLASELLAEHDEAVRKARLIQECATGAAL